MVGPIPSEDRLAASRRIKLAVVLFVGLSAGLITLQGDPTVLVFVLAVAIGLVVGAVVVALAFPHGLGFRD